MKSRAFTVVELLVCIAIIGITFAISFSLVGTARERASRESCKSNLRQLWLAIEMYRNDNGGGATSGSLAEMALPSEPNELIVDKLLWSSCKAQSHPQKILPINYQWLGGISGSQVEKEEWIPQSNKYREHTVIIADWRHNDDTSLSTTYYPKLGIGISVAGELQVRTAPGKVPSVLWWDAMSKSNQLGD